MNKNKNGIKNLIDYCKPYMVAIVIALICAVGGTVCTLAGPDRLSDITDKIRDGIIGDYTAAAMGQQGPGIDIDGVVSIAVFLLVLYIMSAVLSFVQGFIMNTVTQRICNGLRSNISVKINKMPLKYFDSVAYGDVLSRVTNDVDMIGQTLNQSIGNLVSAVSLFIGSLIMMFKIDWIMALSAIISSIIGFALMMFIMVHSQKFFTRQQKELGAINSHVEEIYSGHTIVKAYNAVADAGKEFDEMNENLYDSAWKSQFLSGIMQPLMGFIGNLGYVAVCVTGAVLTMNGDISFGVIVAFMVYVRLFTQPLSQMAQAATSLQSASAASGRVFEFLNEDEMENEDGKPALLSDVKGDVKFEHVKFGYNPEKTIIKDFSIDVKAGQKVAIVGPTGAGKTTLVNLLMRFYETNSGEIYIDGVPVKSVTRENIHDQFCMVLQDTWVFEGTIRENIVFSKENVSDEEVEKACKAVGIDRYIKALPNGYDTVMDDKANLSVGQKQLITIARAMVENAPLLILDEATSSVDTRTELQIQKAMDILMKGRTSFVIAHRLSTIKNADVILVMKDGDIVESGNHEELMIKGGFYAELYNSQFEVA